MHFTDNICINVNVKTSFNQCNVAYNTFIWTIRVHFNLLFRVVQSTLYRFLLQRQPKGQKWKKIPSQSNIWVSCDEISLNQIYLFIYFFMWVASSWGDQNTQRKQTINFKWQSTILTNFNDADCQSKFEILATSSLTWST